jgi:acetoacetyl-CoA synthetase
VLLADYVAGHDTSAVPYNRLPFSHPLYILFSSGTTGKPKCIMHRAGGSLLQGMKEAMLHHDVHQGDRVLFYTSTNWVIWNVHLSYLSVGAAMLTYEGSPLYPDPEVLFDYAASDGATLFGSSAKFVDSLRQRQVPVGERYDLTKLRTLLTSGSTLVEESFDYIIGSIKKDLHIASTSGGTDVMCGFVVSDASQPVWRWACLSKSGATTANACRREKRASWFVTSRFPLCPSDSSATRTAAAIARPITNTSPGSGATATI